MVESFSNLEREFKPIKTECVIIRNWKFPKLRDWLHGKYPDFNKDEQRKDKKMFYDLDEHHQDDEVARIKSSSGITSR
jgi:hypothetical protein